MKLISTYKGAAIRLPLAEIMLLLVAMFWGTSYGVTKEALAYTTVIVFLATRFCLTFLVMLPMLLLEIKKQRLTDWYRGIPSGLILFAIFISESYGVFHTSASNAAFLISFCVLLTPILEWLVFKQFPGTRLFVFVLIFLIGSYLLVSDNSSITINFGDKLILFSALLRASMVVATKKWVSHKRISTFGLTSVQMGVVGIGSLLLALSLTDNLNQTLIALPFNYWVSIGYLVMFCTIFAFFAQNYGVKNTSPSKASLLMGSEPVFGGIFAMIWLGETLSNIQLLGAILLVFASLGASYLPYKKPNP